MDDNEVSLPKATLVKLIKDYMPHDLRVASDATDMLVACCTEFVSLVGSEANTVAGRGGKKTVQPEHVLSALQELGYPEFCGAVEETWDQFKEEAKASSSQKAALRKTGADQAGLTQEEQIALQQQMFAAARAASITTADSAAMMAAAYQAQLQAQMSLQGGATGEGGVAKQQLPISSQQLPVQASGTIGTQAASTAPSTAQAQGEDAMMPE